MNGLEGADTLQPKSKHHTTTLAAASDNPCTNTAHAGSQQGAKPHALTSPFSSTCRGHRPGEARLTKPPTCLQRDTTPATRQRCAPGLAAVERQVRHRSETDLDLQPRLVGYAVKSSVQESNQTDGRQPRQQTKPLSPGWVVHSETKAVTGQGPTHPRVV